jgi:hypothetical protein
MTPGAPVGPTCGDAGCGWEPTVTFSFDGGAALYGSARPIDILFVVDDTPAMVGVEASLVAQLATFAQVFQALPLGPPAMHVAFVPATLPSADCAPPSPHGTTCGLAAGDQFFSVDFCGIDQNGSGTPGDAFTCLGSFGAQGCGPPQPLEAARRALGGDPAGGALTGRSSFIGAGSSLQIVFVTAQDDASTRNGELAALGDYVTFFKSLTADPANDLLISVIGPERCASGAPVAATPTPRLDQVAGAVGPNGVAVSICDANLAVAFRASAAQSGVLILPPCLAGIKDTDPVSPGIQPDCFVDDEVVEADGSQRRTRLTVCDPDAPVPPCLSLLSADAPGAPIINKCLPGSLAPYVLRAADPVSTCGPYSTHDRVTCVTCADPNDPACAGP